MKRLLSAALAAALAAGAWAAAPPAALESARDRETYSLGYQIGQDLRHQSVELRPDAVRRGLADGLQGASPQMTPDEMRRTLLELKRRITSRDAAESRKQAARQQAEEAQFLAENAKKESVVSLPSGLQYKVIREGTGRRPGPRDQVTLGYSAALVTGMEFDSTAEEGEPATVFVQDLIPGWREGVQLMKEGARWQLFVPPALGYGVRGPLADRAVILDVELLKVQEAPPGGDPVTAPAGRTQ